MSAAYYQHAVSYFLFPALSFPNETRHHCHVLSWRNLVFFLSSILLSVLIDLYLLCVHAYQAGEVLNNKNLLSIDISRKKQPNLHYRWLSKRSSIIRGELKEPRITYIRGCITLASLGLGGDVNIHPLRNPSGRLLIYLSLGAEPRLSTCILGTLHGTGVLSAKVSSLEAKAI